MIDSKLPIYLASSSQRRIKLLKLMNLKFKTISVNINENIIQHESPVKTVKRLANEKLEAAKKVIGRGIIITADTLVSLDSIILGKPVNEKEAIKFLKKLSNKTHSVYTGFAVFNSETQVT
ncbi:MAG TPA: septum formation initiator, partial [Ignavibacteria bacterium]|nr:septum formation initiator [Ignavibacteria bacterium]